MKSSLSRIEFDRLVEMQQSTLNIERA